MAQLLGKQGRTQYAAIGALLLGVISARGAGNSYPGKIE
jgi:hypothetical protein